MDPHGRTLVIVGSELPSYQINELLRALRLPNIQPEILKYTSAEVIIALKPVAEEITLTLEPEHG